MSTPTAERTRPTRIRRGSEAATWADAAVVGPMLAPAVGKAYARRAGRRERMVGVAGPDATGRPRFVLLVMVLLGVGLVASLWLSTTAAADSYRLTEAANATRDLSERSEALRTEIAAFRSAPALAQAARDLGMVPTSDVARLVAMPEGSVIVVGTPKAAVAPVPTPVALPPAQPGVAAGQPGSIAPGQPDALPPGQPDALPPSQPGAVTQPSPVPPGLAADRPGAAALAAGTGR